MKAAAAATAAADTCELRPRRRRQVQGEKTKRAGAGTISSKFESWSLGTLARAALLLGAVLLLSSPASSVATKAAAKAKARAQPSKAAREWRRAIDRANALNYRELIAANARHKKSSKGGGGAPAPHVAAAAAHGVNCAWRDPSSDARFDLAGLKLPYGSSYMFHDVQVSRTWGAPLRFAKIKFFCSLLLQRVCERSTDTYAPSLQYRPRPVRPKEHASEWMSEVFRA
jgi:hypothetical protein